METQELIDALRARGAESTLVEVSSLSAGRCGEGCCG